MTSFGIVIIGRNEGERLVAALRAVRANASADTPVVYVDSGSTDGSVAAARAAHCEVVELDMTKPFTAARARNTGFARLMQAAPGTGAVQFIDGDCVIREGWLQTAAETLATRADAGVVCGRRRESRPEASRYNRLCDLEWNTPVGEARSCGGDAMFRASALQEVGGYNPAQIAGEEPELCVRLRAKGWKVLRLDHEMTLHDAAMTRFSQWWKRAVRAGYAYANGAHLHGRTPDRHNVKEVRSIIAWAGVLPAVMLALAWPTRGISLALLALAYVLLFWRIRQSRVRRGDGSAIASLYARFCVIGKFAQLLGVWRFTWTEVIRGKSGKLIEYKPVPASPAAQN